LDGGALFGAAARHFITATTANRAGGADNQAGVRSMSAFGTKQKSRSSYTEIVADGAASPDGDIRGLGDSTYVVARNSVLQERGAIRTRRGRITLLDRRMLERSTCKCYQAIGQNLSLGTTKCGAD